MDAFDIAKTLLSMRAPEPDAPATPATVPNRLRRRARPAAARRRRRVLALSRDSFAGLVVDTAREESARATAPGLRLSYVDGATLRGCARRAADPAPAPRAAPVSAASTPAGSVAHTPSSSAPGRRPRPPALFLDLRSHATDLGALRDVGARARGVVAATGCVVVLASSTKPARATVLSDRSATAAQRRARVAVPLGGLASDSERRVLEILQWLACSERLHSWAALDLDGLRGARTGPSRARQKANPTFGGRFVAARRLDDAAETELVRQLLADERGSADDGAPSPALEGAENANSAPRSPTSGRAGRKLLRCLDENTPTERSPFSRPANKHFRAAAADAAAAPPDAPLLPQLSPFTKVAAI
ncbi:hypothetical protein SO694_00132062 [Aureococcus anophagefferens]|uniref:Uncharacterized protein n=1 Tax=Aureococcus anophagefferens TaxID=44056 RepID=A0ABR1GFY1_AURAN